MSDFKARIIAELDTSKAEQQINQLGKNKKVKIDADTGNAQKNINNLNTGMKSAGNSAQSFGQKLKHSLDIGSTAAIAYKGIRLIEESARDAYEAIKDFDGAITDLRMATNDSYDNVRNLVKGYNDMGKSLGAITTEVTDSADAWLRQGHTVENTNTLIKDSMILSKVASIDSADATEYLTSAMKGYKVAVEDVIGIVDKLTAVDLVSATDAGGLAEAMSRTAVTADMAGVSMDKLLGYLAVVGETTQKSMSSVGESFKTIFTRMNDIKSDKLELVDEDGTIEKLSDVETTLANVGISLRDTMTEFNSSEEILDNLASKWNTLNSVQQAAISKAFAGTRQSENFKVLMENYSKAQEYMNTAINSTGTAEQKFNAYLDSIESKLNTLQASFESLAFNAVSTELVGGVIEASTAVLEFLDNTNLLKGALVGLSTAGVIKGFTLLATGISNTAIKLNEFHSALKLLKAGNIGTDEIQKLASMTANLSQSQLKAVLSSKALSTEQRVAILTSQGMSAAEAKATLATMGLASAEGTATAATFSLSGAFKGLWATLMANPLILVVAGVTAAVSAYSSYKQKAEEARQATLEMGSAAKTEADNIKDLYNAYSLASDAYASNTGSKEELQSATDALLEALGVEQSEIDNLVEKYGNLDDAIQQVTVDSLKEKLADLTAGYEESLNVLLETTKDGFFGDFSKIDFRKINGAYQTDPYVDVLKNAGFDAYDDFGYSGGYHGSFIELGDTSSLEGVIEMYEKLHEMRLALETGVDSGLYDRTELAETELYQDINDKLNSFSTEYQEVADYITKINETSALLQLDKALEDTVPKTTEEFEAFKKEMIETAKESGQFVGSQEDIENAINNTCATLPELSGFYEDTANTVDSASDAIGDSANNVTENIVTMYDNVQSLVSSIQDVQDIVNSQSTGKSISLADFNADGMEDYKSALEYVNGTLQLNAEKVNEIIKAKAEEQIAINDTNKALEQSKYLENAKEIEKLRQKIRDNNLAEGETVDSINASINSYLAQNASILETCNNYDLMTASLREATGAYQHWLNAQNASQSGDMFDSSIEAMQKIHDTLNDTESDSYGRIGNEDYKAAVDFVVPESIDHEDSEAVNKYMDSISDLFTYDDDGKRTGLDIMSFCQKAVDAGLMTLDESTDEYKIAGQKTMQDFADGLGLSLPLVQAMFGEMEEFGGTFDWADEAIQTMGDLGVAATESAEALRKIEGNEDLVIRMDVSDITDKQEAISTLQATIDEMNGVKAKPGVDASEIEYANSIIRYCVEQQQQLSSPTIMDVDTSLVEGKIGEAISLLQEFQTAQNNLEMQKSLGLDTSEAQASVDALTQKIQSADNAKIMASLEVDTTSADTISTTLSAITPELLVKCHVDESAIIGYTASDKDATVTYDKDSTIPDNYEPEDKTATVTYYKISTSVDLYNPKNLTRYVTYKAVGSGTQGVNGTAHASGTAKAGGDWGTAKGGATLTGELGQEIVVNPRTGRWYTVGDNGAEFVDIPQGAIVFNHEQTKALLERGYVTGRGKALVSGTAMVTGGIKLSQAQKSTGNYTPPSSSKNTSTKNNNTSKNNATKKTADEFEESFDWVEIALNRIVEAIDRIKIKADSVFKTFTKRNKALSDEISYIYAQIDLQNDAYNRYMEEANSVGLSETWAKKVRNGSIDISTITDESLAEQIKEYQEFYEKAIEAKDAVAELHEEIASLYKEKFDNVASKYDNEIALLEHMTNSYENGIANLEARGYLTSSKYYKAMKSVENQKIQTLNKELDDLIKAMSEGVNSGEIAVGSEAWYEMQHNINKTKEEIQEANTAVIELDNSIRDLNWETFDYIQERISSVTNEAQFLIDLMASSDLYDNKGQLTDTGMATMGLHGQNYNTYMSQADQYASEIKEMNQELANDPYNTDLIARREELLELQRESILAAEDEKQAIIDMVTEGIQIELDSLKELIDTYTNALDSAKDLYDYQKKIKEQTDTISAIQKQISAYKGDTSEENRARLQKLEVDLSDAMEELQETEYDHYISEQKKMMDNLYTEYELILNQRLDNIDSLIGEMIDATNTNASTIKMTLETESANVGYTMTEGLKAIWSNEGGANAIITKYGDNFSGQLTSLNTVLNAISVKIDSMTKESDKQADEIIKDTAPTTATDPTVKPKEETKKEETKKEETKKETTKTIKVGGKINAGSAKIYEYAGDTSGARQYFRNDPIYTVLAEKSGYLKVRHHKLSSGVTGWFKKADVKAYKTGGLVDETGYAWLDGTPQKPEMVLDADDTENLIALKNALAEMAAHGQPIGITGASSFNQNAVMDIVPIPMLPDVSKHISALSETKPMNIDGHVEVGEINIPIEHVNDYNDFVNQLRQDGKFEKMIETMTFGKMFGGSQYAKNKYKW